MSTPVTSIALLSLIALLFGCSSGSGSGSVPADRSGCPGVGTTAAAPLLAGRLIETGTTTLEEWNAGRRQTIACTATTGSYFEYPTFSPDGKSIAYVLAGTPTATGQDWGNDVYLAAVDGSNPRLLLKHDAQGALVDALVWTPDGTALILGYNRAVFDASGRYQSSILQIQRVNIATGERTVLIPSGSQPSLSWDGKSIVYVLYPSPDLQASDLAMAGIDGGNQHEILTTQHGFQAFFAPHLSPDGRQIVFAAVGGPLPAAPQGLRADPGAVASTAQSLGRRWLAPPAAFADGTPYQVWVANLDGSDLHTVADLREDLPYPLWTADGRSILFLGASALYLVSATGGDVKRIDKGIPHGQIAWYQP
jgi:Tol biopolymer transport system component